jgi:hypothetical protein
MIWLNFSAVSTLQGSFPVGAANTVETIAVDEMRRTALITKTNLVERMVRLLNADLLLTLVQVQIVACFAARALPSVSGKTLVAVSVGIVLATGYCEYGPAAWSVKSIRQCNETASLLLTPLIGTWYAMRIGQIPTFRERLGRAIHSENPVILELNQIVRSGFVRVNTRLAG